MQREEERANKIFRNNKRKIDKLKREKNKIKLVFIRGRGEEGELCSCYASDLLSYIRFHLLASAPPSFPSLHERLNSPLTFASFCFFIFTIGLLPFSSRMSSTARHVSFLHTDIHVQCVAFLFSHRLRVLHFSSFIFNNNNITKARWPVACIPSQWANDVFLFRIFSFFSTLKLYFRNNAPSGIAFSIHREHTTLLYAKLIC